MSYEYELEIINWVRKEHLWLIGVKTKFVMRMMIGVWPASAIVEGINN